MDKIDLNKLALSLKDQLKQGADQRELDGSFAAQNHELLKSNSIFSAIVPLEMGGGGATYAELASFLKQIAAYNSSTALSLAMHQHVVCTAVYNDKNGRPGRALLEKVAANQPVLVSTGANDWMESNGKALKVEGGYSVTAFKPFASGSPSGQMLVSSCRYQDPEKGAQVIHFALPLNSDGVKFADDWDAMGMRETGSQTVILENAFVPDAAVSVMRPQAGYCKLFDFVVPNALPLVMSVYLGIAEAAADIALARASAKQEDEVQAYLVGEMLNALTMAQITVQNMLSIHNEWGYEASIETTNLILIRKTIAANAVTTVAKKAMEIAGGAGYFRKLGLEKMLRDILAAQYHPMQEKRQHRFTGLLAMGQEPVT